MKITLSLCGFPTESNHEKQISYKFKIEEQSTKNLTSTPQNCQRHQKQGKSEMSHRDESKET